MTKLSALVFLALLIPATASAQRPEAVRPGTGNASTIVSDVTIPDGTVMIPGQSFTKTWKIRNSGTISWTGYNLGFVDGTQMAARSSVSVPMTPPGANVDISVPMTAPADAGVHKSNWQMRTADGALFGTRVFVVIQVNSSTYEGRVFEDWEADLSADLPAVREKALNALSRFGPRATPALIKSFRRDPDEKVRGLALAALGDVKPLTNDAVSVFLEAATDPSPTVSWIAVMIIQQALPSRIGPEAVPALVEAMRDASPIRRQLAIQLLAGLGPAAKEAAPTLHELADSDPEARVRGFANGALQRIERGGVVSGNNYSSPRNWFSVQLPKSSNWANVPFAIRDASVNQPTVGNYDLVSFEVKDFGEVLVAGVGEIPDDVRKKMKRDENRTVLSDLVYKSLRDWRDFPTEPEVVEEIYLTTAHGDSLLQLHRVERGSLLTAASGRRPTPADTFETLIAVVVAKQEDHYVYAIAENDAESRDRDKSKEVLEGRVQAFFSSVVVHR